MNLVDLMIINILNLMTNRYFRFFLLLVILGCTSSSDSRKNEWQIHYFTLGKNNRTIAEWEPSSGTLITWPLCIPFKLAVELAKDNHLYTLVSDVKSKNEAEDWYQKWAISDTNNTFIITPLGIDGWWTRDWGPSGIFTNDGNLHLGDGKYIYATPNSGPECKAPLQFIYKNDNNEIIKTEIDDYATLPVGKALNIPVLDLPYINTGGNVLTDGLGTAFSSCILLNENEFFKVSKEKFFQLNKTLSGYQNYHILSNFEKNGIQHLDCFMKLLDEERMLVALPPSNHELFPLYENIVNNELKNLTNSYGRPYEILRIKTAPYRLDNLAAYTNSLILNKTIYVPLFQIPEDKTALETWQKVMPGYTVKGFTFALKDEPLVSPEMKKHYRDYGWNHGDALHCRTRAIWDKDMLFITFKKLPAMVEAGEPLTVYATIIDYSKKGLEKDAQKLYWRPKGKKEWNEIPLKKDGDITRYKTDISLQKGQKGIFEYYISAASLSGKRENKPRTAPEGFYTVEVK
ncbi:MAG: agmatine deiminase family protein [Saprospiraceae bacterium]|nr:agmatine deiminase family protein [Saprospiraceae bacterium]